MTPEMIFANTFDTLIDLNYETKKKKNGLDYKSEVKSRKCLRCHFEFRSSGNGNRCCGSCVNTNKKTAQLKIDSLGL